MGRIILRTLTRALETVRVVPRGTSRISDFLNVGADALVRGGETGIFTPMAFMLAQKPG